MNIFVYIPAHIHTSPVRWPEILMFENISLQSELLSYCLLQCLIGSILDP